MAPIHCFRRFFFRFFFSIQKRLLYKECVEANPVITISNVKPTKKFHNLFCFCQSQCVPLQALRHDCTLQTVRETIVICSFASKTTISVFFYLVAFNVLLVSIDLISVSKLLFIALCTTKSRSSTCNERTPKCFAVGRSDIV